MDADNSKIKVLVTGASGFLGAHCCRLLLELGYQVRGTVRSLKDTAKVGPLRKICPVVAVPLELVEADLLDAQSWERAVSGCTYVLHTACPTPESDPEDEQTVLLPAVTGTLNVLSACKTSNSVKRAVYTSCSYAIAGEHFMDYDKVYSESDWSNINASMAVFAKCKTLAEKAAWKFMEELAGDLKFELAVINPTYIMGPIIHGSSGASQVLLTRLMKKEISAVPDISVEFCDVRDVAEAHVVAMILAECAGQRHLINTGVLGFRECAAILHDEFAKQGYIIPTRRAPKFALKIAAAFDKSLALLLPRWGKELCFNMTRMTDVLKIEPRAKEDTILDMTYSLIEAGILPKAPNYKKANRKISRQTYFSSSIIS